MRVRLLPMLLAVAPALGLADGRERLHLDACVPRVVDELAPQLAALPPAVVRLHVAEPE